MKKTKNLLQSNSFALVIVLCGFVLRLLVASRGHNYDFDSYRIVAQIVERGGNVYASTVRYNYGPIWFNVLSFIFQISSKNVIVFRYMLAGFLSFVDLSIFVVLHKKLGRTAAFLFFLNPISIIITGYHNQFGNLALLLGMLSLVVMGDDFEISITKRKFLGLVILGLSLVTKHILFLLPLWLAIKQKGAWQKVTIMTVPIALFFFSFAPYWHEGQPGIIQNVFLYNSFNNEYFYKLFVPLGFQAIFTSTAVWVILLFVFAFVFRQRKGFDSLVLYTCILVAASPSIANQYLAIVIPFVSMYLNPFTVAYSVLGTIYLLFDHSGIHIQDEFQSLTYVGFPRPVFYPFLVILLCLGFVRSVWFQQLRVLGNRIYLEARIQLGYEVEERF